jgi:hypothetical protein
MSSRLSKRIKFIPENTYDKPKYQCVSLKAEDGSTVFVKIQLPVGKRKQFYRALEEFIPLIRNEELRVAPDGIYTWILSDTGFSATRVLSLLELGTIHHSLVLRSHTNELFGAGELEKRGDTIRYNIQSGSYMKNLVGENASRGAVVRRDFEDAMKSFGFLGESIHFEDASFIGTERLPITRAELDVYVRAGYEVWFFDTEDECKLFGADQILKEDIEKAEEAISVYSGMADERFKAYTEELKASVVGKRTLLASLESVPIVGKRYATKGGRKTRKASRTTK